MSVNDINPGRRVKVATWSELEDRKPTYACVAGVDLVIVRYDDAVSVLYGRCLHRGALLSNGFVRGEDLICGLHRWDYRVATGVSAYDNDEALHKFHAWIDHVKDAVFVDQEEIEAWEKVHPQPYRRDEYLGLYEDFHGSDEEPYNRTIRHLAEHGLKVWGHHGRVSAMGVPLTTLPRWDDIQILTAQLSTTPLYDDAAVDTTLVIGPSANKPLILDIPLLVSDMSFGALSEEAKVALARGAEMAGTGICSGEGGMLPEEQAACSRYFYELASGMFGWHIDKVKRCQAFHFKAGQGAKTGTGGYLPGNKVSKKIARVRGLVPGKPAVSPARFPDLETAADFQEIAEMVRESTGGIPIGFKMSAQHIEDDIDFALSAGADYVILDGRGGGTGAAPEIFKDNISVPTMVALARARRHLDACRQTEVTLIITGGLRTAADFVKAMALGADGVAVANAAIQAIGCLGMRACHTNLCPVGVTTQDEALRKRLRVEESAKRLKNFLQATTELMKILARACAHRRLSEFNIEDLTTWKREIAQLTGIRYSGVVPLV